MCLRTARCGRLSDNSAALLTGTTGGTRDFLESRMSTFLFQRQVIGPDGGCCLHQGLRPLRLESSVAERSAPDGLALATFPLRELRSRPKLADRQESRERYCCR